MYLLERNKHELRKKLVLFLKVRQIFLTSSLDSEVKKYRVHITKLLGF